MYQMSKKLYHEGNDYQQTPLSEIRKTLKKNTLLETFSFQEETPGDQIISISSPELTCICPFSEFPDFGVVYIKYAPKKKCLELKSFKLYIGAFRNIKIFHEGVTEVILADFIEAIDPKWVEVIVEMNPRGNVTTVCKKQYSEK